MKGGESVINKIEQIDAVVEKYSDMIIRIAYQNLKNQSDAEDVAQEVFLKLMREEEFEDEGHRKAWLIRVTINLCKDVNKSAWNRKTEGLIETWETVDREQLRVLDELWELPKDYRNVVYLYYYEELTIPEIAKIIKRKENTVSSWLTRARKKLKTILVEGGYRP